MGFLVYFRKKVKRNIIIYFIFGSIRYSWNLLVSFPRNFLDFFYSIVCYGSIRVFLSNHFTCGIKILSEKRTKFPHPVGIVIGKDVTVSNDCIIYQNVTIGSKDGIKYPIIGKNVIIYPNSVIIGDIVIGDNVIVGAGSIVNSNIPDGCTVCGSPARIIRKSS